MQDAASELPRRPILGTSMHKGPLASIVGARKAGEVNRVMAGDGSQQRKPGFKTAVEDVKTVATLLAEEAEDILGRRTAQVLGVLVLFVVVVGTLLAFLNWYVAPSGAAQKQALVVSLAQILGGTALLSGLYFTWRTLQVNREGQITERFTRAIEQLGATHDDNSKNLELRWGGSTLSNGSLRSPRKITGPSWKS
jgi:hypothetical protein